MVDRVDPQRLQPQADGADRQPADHSEDDGPLEERGERDEFDDDGRAEVEREPVDRRAEDRADHQRDQAAQADREKGGNDGRAAAEHHPGGDERERSGRRDQHRFEHLAELGDAEVEFDLEHRQADDDAAEAEILDGLEPDAFLGLVVAHRPLALVFEEERGDRREPGTADHHQVGRPPQRDVLAEDAVPDVVEREAGQGVQPAAGHQDTADRRVPVAGDPYRERTGLLVGQHDRRAAGDEQKEQARPG